MRRCWLLLTATLAGYAPAAELTDGWTADHLARGTSLLRQGDLAAAEAQFRAALRERPDSVPALLGLGRSYTLGFDRRAALTAFADAFRADPSEPAVIRHYAAATPDRKLEAALLNRLLRHPAAPGHWAMEARGRLDVIERLAGRTVNELQSPYQSYDLKMPEAYGRNGQPVGWILRARINGKRELRLLLDTGARGILLGRREAVKLGLEPLAAVSLGGFGEGARPSGSVTLAARLTVQGLEFANVMVETVDSVLPIEFDGLIGLDLFRQFHLTLDGRRKVLRLDPFADADPRDGAGERPWMTASPGPGGRSVLQASHLLVVPGETERGEAARYVLDSGAAYTVLQPAGPEVSLREITFQGLSGTSFAPQIARPVRISAGGYRTIVQGAVAMDLTPLSERYNLRIDGFLGFPILCRAVTEIDLRSGQLAIRRR